MEIDQLGRLQDILEACRLIESYVAGVSNDAFFEDTEKQDAVVRRIEIIGEATAHLSDTTRALLPLLAVPANARHAQYRCARLRTRGRRLGLEGGYRKHTGHSSSSSRLSWRKALKRPAGEVSWSRRPLVAMLQLCGACGACNFLPSVARRRRLVL